jgi:hypothetical protein
MARITQIQVRRDTAANWNSVNPTLAAGEIGFETDTGKFKIGTGSLTWNSSTLKYATDGSKLVGTIVANTLATSRNINGVAFNGSADITVTAAPTDSTVTDASIQSTLSPSKITGTAATLAQTRARTYQGSNTLDVPSRQFITAGAAPVNGIIRGYLFTPDTDITVTKISYYVTSASNWSGATSPQAKAGLYTVSGTSFTPLVSSGFTSSPFGTASQLETFTVSSTVLSAGSTYAVALLSMWTGTPSSPGQLAYHGINGGNLAALAPQITFTFGSTGTQTDLTSTLTSPSGTNTPYYARLNL